MRVAMCGPIDIDALLPWLDSADGAVLPSGQKGSPVTELVLGLLRHGTEVVVVTLDPGREQPVTVQGPGLVLHVGPYRPAHRARDLFAAERAFIRAALAAETLDVVHAHWSYENALGALATGLPTLVTVRDWAPAILRFQPTPYRAVRLLMNLAVMERAPALSVPSPYMQQQVARWARRHATVIPNAFPEEMFEERLHGPSLEAPTFLAANNGFSRYKNVDTLFAAFSIVRSRFPQSQLRLIGSGYDAGGTAHTWAKGQGLDHGVVFDGPVAHEEMFPVLRDADVFVHPSREESFGSVLVEAMSQGLPVIAGERSGAVPWVLGEGRAGVLTDIGEPSTLADAMCSALYDSDRWWQLSRAGFQRARTHFRTTAVLPRLLDAYKRVIRGRP